MKNKTLAYLFKHLLVFTFCSFSVISALAQEEKSIVYETWTTGILIDNQTSETHLAQTFEFIILHRFGDINSIDDLFGIYAPSNIRLGLNYAITDNISLGFGTEKNYKLQDFEAKYKILAQQETGMPITLTYYGNMAIDTRDKEVFGLNYKFSNRLSYYNELIVARKFTDKISLQVAGAFSHFNAITETFTDHTGGTVGKWKNDYLAARVAGRYKALPTTAFIFEYTQPFSINEAWEGQNEPMPNLGLGVEFGTSTHAFQVFASQYDAIVAQKNLAYNQHDLTTGDWRYGFNIKVRF